MKKYEITLNEVSVQALINELQLTTEYDEVIAHEETRQYFEYVHRCILSSVQKKLIDAYASFAKKRLFESYTSVIKLKLTALEVRALYYELQDNKEVMVLLQSIVLREKVKLLQTSI